MYKLKFTLRQQTPLIHFQHDQAGATLRATEVKPKLDRFIIEKLTGLHGEDAFDAFKANAEWKKWLVGKGEHPALDYKMRIIHSGSTDYFLPLALSLYSRNYPNKENNLIRYLNRNINKTVNIIAPSPFFANSDKIKFMQNTDQVDEVNTKLDELNFALMTNDNISLSIFLSHEGLKKELESLIQHFFHVENFGMRQSKGFGSFILLSDNNLQKFDSSILKCYQIESVYQKTMPNTSINNIFNDINKTWKIIKAGNSHGGYQKSDIFNYFYHKSTPIRWEKRVIKKILKSNYPVVFNELKYDRDQSENRILIEGDPDTNQFYVRALLGLAEHFEFGTSNYRNKVKIKVSDRLSSSISTSEISIDRFRSPITFKIIGDTIFLIAHQTNPLLVRDKNGGDREFEFYLDAKINGNDHNGIINRLKIPSSFSVSNFLDSDKYDTATGKPKLKNGIKLSVAESFGFTKI
jgi:hypothetical protein